MKAPANYLLAPGVVVEDLGADSVALVPGSTEVLALSGDAAAVVRRIREGESVDGAQAIVSDLVARGVIQPVAGMSRRGLVRAGVIGAGVGIATLAMPSVAAASSPGGSISGLGPNDWFTDVGSSTVAINPKVVAPPWGSGTMPTSPALAGSLPSGFTQPSALTVGGRPYTFLRLENRSTHTAAVWDTQTRLPTPSTATFEVNSVEYEVLLVSDG